MIGQTIAHYKVTAKLGEGGMGEVYRATDSKLGRDVALKVLPTAFAQDAQRMARFQREAQVLASLNHPNIAAIYGLEEGVGSGEQGTVLTRALAMELVEGPTLAERIAQGAMPLEEALPIAKQIAEALEYAHEKGIIHRDLKPGNIKLTSDGKAKVLDFGLAKAMSEDASSSQHDAMHSPTLSLAATRAGVVLGTAAYMSPEQARGKPVDRRADIWAFGVVLYEMLSGRQAYGGETASDSMAAVITREPDWSALPGNLPPHIDALLRRCLMKDEKRRLRDIGEARVALEENAGAAGLGASAPGAPRSTARWPLTQLVPWVLTVALAISLALSVKRSTQGSGPQGVFRFTLPIDVDMNYTGVSIAPDGSQIAYTSEENGLSQLYVRRLSESESRPVSGATLVRAHFFSPDGKWIGFATADRKVKKVSLLDNTITVVGEGPISTGGTWGPDDQIILSPTTGSLKEIPATGGTGKELTPVLSGKGEVGHVWPFTLPQGKAVLFTVIPKAGLEEASIEAVVRDTGERKKVLANARCPYYSSTGHLLFVRGDALLAASFDPDRIEVTGPSFRVMDRMHLGNEGGVRMAVSNSGTMIYATQRTARLLWVEADGREQPVLAQVGAYYGAKISPDGRRLAVMNSGEVWLLDVERNAFTRFAATSMGTPFPSWTPNGDRLTYTSAGEIYGKRVDGSGTEEIVISEPTATWKGGASYSPDGRSVAYTVLSPGTSGDIYEMSLEGKREVRPFLNTKAYEGAPQFSRSGRYIAYVSDETGQREIFVTPYPARGRKWQVSTQGGTHPVWSRDGNQIFYRQADAMMSVSVNEAGEFKVGTPRPVFKGNFSYGLGISIANYDATPDGRRFVMVREDKSAQSRIHVVLNWFEELRQLASQSSKQ